MCDGAGVAVADHSDRRDGGSDSLLQRGLVPGMPEVMEGAGSFHHDRALLIAER